MYPNLEHGVIIDLFHSEAMIRAELNAGNREAASALCDRLESR
jgi:hypothetical protein